LPLWLFVPPLYRLLTLSNKSAPGTTTNLHVA